MEIMSDKHEISRKSVGKLLQFIDVGKKLGRFSSAQARVWKPAIRKLEGLLDKSEEDSIEYLLRSDSIESIRKRMAESPTIRGSTLPIYINSIKRVAGLYASSDGDASRVAISRLQSKPRTRPTNLKDQERSAWEDERTTGRTDPGKMISLNYPLSSGESFRVTSPKIMTEQEKKIVKSLVSAVLDTVSTEK